MGCEINSRYWWEPVFLGGVFGGSRQVTSQCLALSGEGFSIICRLSFWEEKDFIEVELRQRRSINSSGWVRCIILFSEGWFGWDQT